MCPYKDKKDKAKQMRNYRKAKKTQLFLDRFGAVHLIWDDAFRAFTVMTQVGFLSVSISRKEIGNDTDWELKVIKPKEVKSE